MEEKWSLVGRIVSGVRQGAFFTQLDWFQQQCAQKLGFKPYPGTLNLEISDADLPKIQKLEQEADIEFVPPDARFCSGKAYPVTVEGICAAIVMPAREVRVHSNNIIEVISNSKLKDALAVDNGDSVELTIVSSTQGQS